MPGENIREEIFAQKIPVCSDCGPDGIMKPDIVFFGEGLPEKFHDAMAGDKDVADLLIVIGSSLKVRPVALIPRKHMHFSYLFVLNAHFWHCFL